MTHFNKQFATYRNAILRAFAVITFLTLASIATLPKVSLGQCPNSMTPDPGPAWIGPHSMHVILPNTNCGAVITYCVRNNGGNDWEIYIESVTPDPGDTCQDPATVIEGAFNYFTENGDSSDIYVPPCGDTTQTVYTYSNSCWEAAYPPPYGYPTYTACTNSTTYCVSKCDECYDKATGKDIFSNCTDGSSGFANCAPAPPYLWPAGVCYNVPGCTPL